MRKANIKKSDDNCSREDVDKRNSLHNWWSYTLVEPLWKIVWGFLTILNRLPYDPAIPFLEYISKGNKVI
jgi:hypothetical protein